MKKLEQVTHDLHQVADQLIDLKKQAKQLSYYREQKDKVSQELMDLEKQLIKEEKDVDKLHKLSFSNLFHSLINNKAEVLDKEVEEVMALKSKIDLLTLDLEASQDEIERLETTPSKIQTLEASYQALLDEKAQHIKTGSQGQILVDLEEASHHEKVMIREIKEAYDLGIIGLDQAKQVAKSFEKALDWGTLDMLGGGILSSMAKKSHIDEAQSMINRLNVTMKDLHNELGDVGTYQEIGINIDQFTASLDIFFDNIFVDWSVQDKIKKASRETDHLIEDLRSLLSDLEGRLSLSKERVIQLELDIEEFVTSYV